MRTLCCPITQNLGSWNRLGRIFRGLRTHPRRMFRTRSSSRRRKGICEWSDNEMESLHPRCHLR